MAENPVDKIRFKTQFYLSFVRNQMFAGGIRPAQYKYYPFVLHSTRRT